MPTSTLMLLLIVFCVGMAGLIIWIFARQRKASKINQQRIEGLQQMLQKQYTQRVDSIGVIVRAMVDNQCEATEGCIRLKQLLDMVEPDLLLRPEYQVIALVYTSTEHMPIKDQWTQLNKQAKHKFTQQRLALEAQHADAINAAARALKQHVFLAYESLG